MLGKPELIKWWLLKVSGPLPGGQNAIGTAPRVIRGEVER
jgi:hypothetical protein